MISFRNCFAGFVGIAMAFMAPSSYAVDMVKTYDFEIPKEVMGFSYSIPYLLDFGADKAYVSGYSNGDREAALILYKDRDVSQSDEAALLKGRNDIIDGMKIKENTAMNPKIVDESSTDLPGVSTPVAITHLTTEYAGAVTDYYYFATSIKGKLVGLQYKAPQNASNENDARQFASQMLEALSGT